MAMKRKVTQEDLAGRLAVLEVPMTQAQVAKIENGSRPISDFELVAIAKALRVTVQVIVDEAQKIRRTAKCPSPT
jgi:HTH-type transcriptional regulator, cell division transcriptional repressor